MDAFEKELLTKLDKIIELLTPKRSKAVSAVKKNEFNFDEIYRLYPRKLGKKRGYEILRREIKSDTDFKSCMRAATNYAKWVETSGTEERYVQHFSTWCNNWEEWLNSDPNSTREEFKQRQLEI